MEIQYTRALLNAALNGELDHVEMREDPIFGFQVPTQAPGVPADVLDPRKTWPNPAEYDAQAKKLARLFHENFAQFQDQSPDGVRAGGPRAK
jgi:phosphoenolpyruvate carboxykinase (ATP)